MGLGMALLFRNTNIAYTRKRVLENDTKKIVFIIRDLLWI